MTVRRNLLIIIGTRQQLAKVNIDSLCVGDTSIAPVTSVKNLGSWFDEHMTMVTHVKKLCKATSFHLYNIRHIRKYLTSEATHSLVRAFIALNQEIFNLALNQEFRKKKRKMPCLVNARFK